MKAGFLEKGDIIIFSEKIMINVLHFGEKEQFANTFVVTNKENLGTGENGICRLDFFALGIPGKSFSYFFANSDNLLNSLSCPDASDKFIELVPPVDEYNVIVLRQERKFKFSSETQPDEINRVDIFDAFNDYFEPWSATEEEIQDEEDKKIVLDLCRKRATRARSRGGRRKEHESHGYHGKYVSQNQVVKVERKRR